MAVPELDAFQVIADSSRREILKMLTRKTYNINALAENFEMSRPAVSKHIKILQNAGFISIDIVGRERRCKLNQKGFNEIKKWVNYFDKFWIGKLKNLETVLNKKSK